MFSMNLVKVPRKKKLKVLIIFAKITIFILSLLKQLNFKYLTSFLF